MYFKLNKTESFIKYAGLNSDFIFHLIDTNWILNQVKTDRYIYLQADAAKISKIWHGKPEIDENPLNIVSDSWRVKSNGQTIDANGLIELDKVDCLISKLPVIPIPEPTFTWGHWEEWEHCSGSCGYGTRSRFRKCIDGTDETYDCFGEATETQSCEISCEQTQVIDETTSQAGESSDLSN